MPLLVLCAMVFPLERLKAENRLVCLVALRSALMTRLWQRDRQGKRSIHFRELMREGMVAMVLMGWTLLDGRVNSKDTCLLGEGFLLKMIQLASASLTKCKTRAVYMGIQKVKQSFS